MDGNYDIIQRTRARIVLNGELVKELALNEVYVGVENQFHTSRYVINFNEVSEEQRSSGVLVATGTGSAAWYKSAGGEKFGANDDKLKFIVREPYDGNLFRPKILNGEINVGNEIIMESRRIDGGIVAIDATCIYPFNKEDSVRIKVSKQKLNVIIPRK